MVVVRILAGVLVIAHGLVHMLYLVPEVAEFSMERSWLVPEAARRPVALTLIATTIAASAALALAVWGVPGLAPAWPMVAALTGILSLVLLVAYWNTSLLLGVAIDLALIALAVLQPVWLENLLS